jgi:hypothetical protein
MSAVSQRMRLHRFGVLSQNFQDHTVGSRAGRTASLSVMADEMKADALSAAVPCCSRNGRSWSLSERLNRVGQRPLTLAETESPFI